jgi:hypothetical protein
MFVVTGPIDPGALVDAAIKPAIVKAAEQPIETDIKISDDIFVKSILVRKSGTMLPQHSHKFPHISLISAGSVVVYCGNQQIGEFRAPQHVLIPAETKHLFVTREDNTVISCIHRIDRTGEIEVLEEHQIV